MKMYLGIINGPLPVFQYARVRTVQNDHPVLEAERFDPTP